MVIPMVLMIFNIWIFGYLFMAANLLLTNNWFRQGTTILSLIMLFKLWSWWYRWRWWYLMFGYLDIIGGRQFIAKPTIDSDKAPTILRVFKLLTLVMVIPMVLMIFDIWIFGYLFMAANLLLNQQLIPKRHPPS